MIAGAVFAYENRSKPGISAVWCVVMVIGGVVTFLTAWNS